MILDLNKDKLFYQCFSGSLKVFLYNKGIKYLIKCRHYESDKPMWVYLYDKEGLLDKYLEEWKMVRKLNYETEDF